MCTHVIEHILDYRAAIAELRRITGRRLIIVVPRERESIYAFNPHFNFFPYRHSFLRAMIPVPPQQPLPRCRARHLLHGGPRTGAMKPAHLIILALVPLVIAVGQILFKLVSTGQGEVRSVSGALWSTSPTGGCGWRSCSTVSATFAWLAAIRKIPISQAYMFMALSYVYLPVDLVGGARRTLQSGTGRGTGADSRRALFLDVGAERVRSNGS